MELKGYPSNTEATVCISTDELDLIAAMAEAVQGKRRLSEQEIERVEQLNADACLIQLHIPGDISRS